MKAFPELVICEHCDSVYRRQILGAHDVARCECCGAVLYRGSRLSKDQWFALSVAAAIVFVIANICPVIRINFQGLHNEATLWQAVVALIHGAAAPIAVPTAMAVIIVPFLQIALLMWLLAYARSGRRAPGMAKALRLLGVLRPWSMIEVCLLGILVAVIKLSSMLQVVPGPGIWATGGLMVLLTLIANRDVHQLWDGVDVSASEAERR